MSDRDQDVEMMERAQLKDEVMRLRSDLADARLRLLSAAGDDLCRLTQEEIKAYTSGEVQIPPKEEFLPSCERFWEQTAARAGVLPGCFTLAQLIAENERLRRAIEVYGNGSAEFVAQVSSIVDTLDDADVPPYYGETDWPLARRVAWLAEHNRDVGRVVAGALYANEHADQIRWGWHEESQAYGFFDGDIYLGQNLPSAWQKVAEARGLEFPGFKTYRWKNREEAVAYFERQFARRPDLAEQIKRTRDEVFAEEDRILYGDPDALQPQGVINTAEKVAPFCGAAGCDNFATAKGWLHGKRVWRCATHAGEIESIIDRIVH